MEGLHLVLCVDSTKRLWINLSFGILQGCIQLHNKQLYFYWVKLSTQQNTSEYSKSQGVLFPPNITSSIQAICFEDHTLLIFNHETLSGPEQPGQHCPSSLLRKIFLPQGLQINFKEKLLVISVIFRVNSDWKVDEWPISSTHIIHLCREVWNITFQSAVSC